MDNNTVVTDRYGDEVIFETEDTFGALTFTRHYDAVSGEPRIRAQLTPWKSEGVCYAMSVEQLADLGKFIIMAIRALEIIIDPDPPRKPIGYNGLWADAPPASDRP